MFEFTSEIPLTSDENKSYLGITHDGQQTYLSSGDRQIFTLNENCGLINQVSTYCNYHTICYDCVLKRFWAASFDKPGVLFCLSENLEELEPVSLSSENPEAIKIEHLFYDTNGKQLYLTVKNQVYTADETGNLKKMFEIKGAIEKTEGICAYNGYFLCLSCRQGKRYLSVHAISNGDILEEYGLATDFTVSSMTFIQNPLNPLSLYLRFLAVKQEEKPYLIDYKPTLSFFTQYSVSPLAEGSQTVTPSNIQMQQLCGNQVPFFNPGCRSGNYNEFHSSPDNCCYCCPNEPDSCQTSGNCCQSFADVIESIALTEASIAHILNAEGEKLQKAIACSRNVAELLQVNESVLKTITHSTQLEQMLYYKLEAILSTGCCNCQNNHLTPPSCK